MNDHVNELELMNQAKKLIFLKNRTNSILHATKQVNLIKKEHYIKQHKTVPLKRNHLENGIFLLIHIGKYD